MSRQDEDNLEFLLSRHLDGQLDEADEMKLRTRLVEDADLAEQLRQFRSLEERLAAFGVKELAELDYDAQRAAIMSSLERKALLQGSRRRVLIFRPAFWGAMAAAAAVVVAGVLAWRGVVSPRPPGPGKGPVEVAEMVKAVPLAPQISGQAIVRVSSAQPKQPVALPPKPALLPGEPPAGTVLVSITPVDDDSDSLDQTGAMSEFDLPI